VSLSICAGRRRVAGRWRASRTGTGTVFSSASRDVFWERMIDHFYDSWKIVMQTVGDDEQDNTERR
jgi:hypothetical protein